MEIIQIKLPGDKINTLIYQKVYKHIIRAKTKHTKCLNSRMKLKLIKFFQKVKNAIKAYFSSSKAAFGMNTWALFVIDQKMKILFTCIIGFMYFFKLDIDNFS